MLPVLAILFILGLQTGVIRAKNERGLFLELGKGQDSPALFNQLAKKAVDGGDLVTARAAYGLALNDSRVLGADSAFEERLWPEKRWQREWREIEELFLKTNSAKVLLRAAVVKFEMQEKEEAKRYWELAFEMDPNDEDVMRVKESLGL